MNVCPVIGILGQNELGRDGLARVLEQRHFRIVTTSAKVDDFLGGHSTAELILIDTHPSQSVLDDCRLLKQAVSGVRIVLLADTFSPDRVAEAFRSDVVDGYLLKRLGCETLAVALKLVATGEKLFPSEVIASLGNITVPVARRTQGDNPATGNLSAREAEILACLVSGDSNKLIARRLGISDATVKVHIKTLLRKLGVANRTQAAIWAMERGVLADGGLPQSSRHNAPDICHHAARIPSSSISVSA